MNVMLKQAREIIEYLNTLESDFGSIEDALKALLLEKKLDEIFGREKIQGCWIREIGEGRINIGHPQATIRPGTNLSNSLDIIITPFKKPMSSI